MNTSDILSAIDQEISRLEQARFLLQSSNEPSTPAAVEGKRRGRPPGKAAKASVTSLEPVKTTEPAKQTRTMSDDGRARIAAGQKARWAAKKKADTKMAKSSASAPVAKNSTAAAKQAPVKKAAAAVKTAVAKKTAVPAKSAAVKKTAAKKAVPAKTALKKRAADTSSKSAAEAKAEKLLADEATTNAAPPEATASA